MPYVPPSIDDFKERFDRDFAYSEDQTDKSKVRDVDITRGFTQAVANFNENLWGSQATYSEAFLLLTAHYLCTNLLNSSQGLGGAGQWLTNSKAVGPMQESFALPERIMKSPTLAALSKTSYGMTYLQMILPQLAGNVVGICGNTTP